MAERPKELVIRAYQVGFGDCFLLSFRYPREERHVLVDFGTTELPQAIEGGARKHLLAIANDVAKRCNRKLHVVVATHRHRDHIDGFTTAKGGKGPGDVIRACKPEVVIQPWTEHPRATPDARRAPSAATKAFAQRLADMHRFARIALREAGRLRGLTRLHAALSFLGQNNIKNESAVKNLMTMGRRHLYVHAGSQLALAKVLPGVNVRVLGPPNLEQSAKIEKQRRKDPDEFWQLQQRFWGLQAHAGHASNGQGRLFPGAALERDPIYARWLRRQLADARAESLLEIVRILDDAINNTSLILLFDAGRQRLLFPGDAQIESWEYALSREEWKPLLAGVHLYKVGHHGSLNATPKTLWNRFRYTRSKAAAHPLRSLVSTLEGKHGSARAGTEVPRQPLVRELERETEYFTTQSLAGKLYRDLPLALT